MTVHRGADTLDERLCLVVLLAPASAFEDALHDHLGRDGGAVDDGGHSNRA